MRCGHYRAVCGFKSNSIDFAPTIIKNDATTEYNIPPNTAYWENCFFVCNFVLRNQQREIIHVVPLRIDAIWKNYVEYIILKTKPVHTTAIVFIEWQEGEINDQN